jgi:hypothetical protein
MNVFDELRPAKEHMAASRAALRREMGVLPSTGAIRADRADDQQDQGPHAVPPFAEQSSRWKAVVQKLAWNWWANTRPIRP